MKQTHKVSQGEVVPSEWKYVNTVCIPVWIATKEVPLKTGFDPFSLLGLGNTYYSTERVYENQLFDIYEETKDGDPG